MGTSVGSFGISEGNITEKKTPIEYVPNHEYLWRSSSEVHIWQQ